MLATYYDVKTKDRFDEIFGSFDIGKAPTASRNSHLILLFDFSTINPVEHREEVKLNIFHNISRSLGRFLRKYREILGNASPEEYIIPSRIADSLENVLESNFGGGHCHSTERGNRS
jgi:hypothetical protein